MIVDLPDTTTNDLNKKITALREEGGAITLGRVLTLVVAPDSEDLVEDAIDAAVSASREHPCRIIVVVPADRLASDARLDGQLRVGGDAGAVSRLDPIFAALAPGGDPARPPAERGYLHCGPAGAGHFVKMIHPKSIDNSKHKHSFKLTHILAEYFFL